MSNDRKLRYLWAFLASVSLNLVVMHLAPPLLLGLALWFALNALLPRDE